MGFFSLFLIQEKNVFLESVGYYLCFGFPFSCCNKSTIVWVPTLSLHLNETSQVVLQSLVDYPWQVASVICPGSQKRKSVGAGREAPSGNYGTLEMRIQVFHTPLVVSSLLPSCLEHEGCCQLCIQSRVSVFPCFYNGCN